MKIKYISNQFQIGSFIGSNSLLLRAVARLQAFAFTYLKVYACELS